MNAIILAAGAGSRLRPYTLDRPKCLVELAGRTLLAHQIDALHDCGIENIRIVTGYRGDQIAAVYRGTVHSSRYAGTNMCVSLMAAADWLDGRDDVLVAYSDIVYEPRLVTALLGCGDPLATVVDLDWRRLWAARMEDPLADAETLRMDAGRSITEIGGVPQSYDDIEAQYVGLIKLSADFAPRWVRHFEDMEPARQDAMSMTEFLQVLIDGGCPLTAVAVRGGWLEVDSRKDLERYQALLRNGRLHEFVDLGALPAGG